jgi:hypothetical protein
MAYAGYGKFQSYKDSKQDRDEYYTSMYVRIKDRLLNKRDRLIEAYDNYYKICVVKKIKNKQKINVWIMCLVSLYNDVRDKLSDDMIDEKNYKIEMDGYLCKNQTIPINRLYDLHQFILTWFEESGLAKIAIDKRKFEDLLENEEHSMD